MRRTGRLPLTHLIVLASLLFLLNFQNLLSSDQALTGIHSDISVRSSTSAGVEMEFSLENFNMERLNVGINQVVNRFLDEKGNNLLLDNTGLPVVTRMVLIPPQGGVEVKVSNINVRNLLVEEGFVSVESHVYVTENEMVNRYADPVIELGHPAIMRGYRLIPLIIHPMIKNAQTDELELVESLDISLDFNSDNNLENQVVDPERRRSSRYIDKMIRNLVVNPPEPSRDEGYPGGSIVYVIGDWDEVEEGLEPLIEWRRRLGWKVEVIRVNRNNDRIDIYDALDEAYQEWEYPPEYIVLVGDAPGLQGNDYTLGFWNMQDGGRYPYETDHLFATLEGNDVLPEAAIGRLVIDSEDMLEAHVTKIVQYESNPSFGAGDERGWQLRAAGAATDSRSGTSSIDICRWFEELVMSHGYESFDELYWSDRNPQPNPSGFIWSNFNDGISFMLYRGWANMNGFEMNDVNQLRNGRMLPFVMLATCNTGDYGQVNNGHSWSYAERLSYHSNGGAIGCVGAAGATHSAYNNMLATGTLRAPFAEGIFSQGWALMRGKLDLYTHYADRGDINHEENYNMEAWLTEFFIYNLMGDPAVELFTAVPVELDADHPVVIRKGETKLSVYVLYADEEIEAEDAQVCLYKPDQFQLVKRTNSEGWAEFVLNPDWTQDGEIQITASGRNLAPYLAEVNIVDAEWYIGAGNWVVDDDGEGDSHGDEDGMANPTERIELIVDIVNYGNQVPEGEMDVILTSESPWIDIIEGAVNFNVAPDVEERFECTYLVDIQEGFPAGTDAEFTLDAVVGEESWQSTLSIPVEGFQLDYATLDWHNDPLVPGDTAEVAIILTNYGSKPSPELNARLFSNTGSIFVPVSETSFEPILPGNMGESAELVSLGAGIFHLGGSKADLGLLLTSENDYRDTLFFSVIIDRARDGQPFGPDEHGYICIDNTDEDWHFYPEYDWIEIDPDQDGNGTNSNLVDTDEEEDASMVTNLPFVFTYYGERFNQVTICTNGWIALGDHHNLISARNRRIPAGEVISAMICPFWDDLVTTENGGIYYWYDENAHRFIIEWSRMRKLGPEGNREPWESFQVILYDPAFYPSVTGDGDIVFQYREVTDNRSCFQAWDTPFATVGIANIAQNGGLEYTYWGELHDGAAELVPGRAIKFTTTSEFETGCIDGYVRDWDSREPLSDALVVTSTGSWSITNNEGYYLIASIPVDTGYSVVAGCEFHNDSTINRIDVVENDTTEVVFYLLSPSIAINPDEIQVETYQDKPVEEILTLGNPGSGTLTYESRFTFPDWDADNLSKDEADEMWEPLLTWEAGLMVGDYRLHGIVFAEDRWIVSGGNNGYDQNWFYVFDRDGEYLTRLGQPIQARYGTRDMEYYDGNLYCVFSESFVMIVDPETGEELELLSTPGRIQSPRSLTIDPRTGVMYVSGVSGGVYALCDQEGSGELEIIDQWEPVDPRDGEVILPYGMAWFRDDPDDCNIYLISNHEPENDVNSPNIAIYKLNIHNGETHYLTNLDFMHSGFSGRCGICITALWDGLHWVLAGIFDNSNGDQANVLEIGQNSSWIDYSPRTGTVLPEESQDITVLIDPSTLNIGDYRVTIEFDHNAFPGKTEVPVVMSVLVGANEDDIVQPFTHYLAQNFPNPFNPVTTIEYGVSEAGLVKLTVFDITGREVSRLVNDTQQAGRYRIQFVGESLAAGVYVYWLETGGFSSMRKMVMVK